MDKMFKIENDYAEITISKYIYPLVVVKKAIANYMEDIYVKLEEDVNNIIIRIQLNKEESDLNQIIGEFYNELLRESLRYDIACETKNLRELIVARALYTTCIEDNDELIDGYEENNDDFNLDDIAVNWFEKNNDEEEYKC